ncbi:MAG: FtsW/RodA/SpoVE family cell cycle protein [Chitinophagaceae bacterium]
METIRNIANEINLPFFNKDDGGKLYRGDKVIWSIVLVLVLASLLVVYSSTGSLAYKHNKGNTEFYLFKQLAFIIGGVLIIVFAHRVNYTVYSRIALWFYLLSLPLLLYTLVFGANYNEASRWIRLPILNMTLQTSDMAKLGLFMYLARQLSRKKDVITDFKKGFLPLMAPVVLTCLLIAPANLSTALLVGSTSMIIMFMGRVQIKHILLAIGVAALPILILIMMAVGTHKTNENDTSTSEITTSAKSHGRVGTWIRRIQDFMYTKNEASPYQVQQAKIAIAKGGWIGMGPGNSEQRNFLPHPYSDYIYAIIIEEYGIMGGVFILFIYLVFLHRCIRLFRKCPYAFGAFLALGLSVSLVIQAMANMAVNVGLFPVTGVTLPLVSMGGTSFLFTCFAIGIILSVARNVEQMEGRAMDN